MRSWPALELTLRRPSNAGDESGGSGMGRWELIQAALIDFDVAAIDDNAEDVWRVFFRTPDGRDGARNALRQRFEDLAIVPLEVPDEDWAARSQAGIQAVRVGSIVVAPPWSVGAPPETTDPVTTIVIEPSMGFGTGHHASTRLCLAHLQRLDLRQRTVVDVGTGSGVLAIAASRLGGIHVLAIDDDPDAIESARRNLSLNAGAEVTLGVVDLRRAMLRRFDVVLANLTGGLLGSAAGTLQALAASGGHLVLGGFMDVEEPAVLQAFSSCTSVDRSQEDEWVCMTLRSPS